MNGRVELVLRLTALCSLLVLGCAKQEDARSSAPRPSPERPSVTVPVAQAEPEPLTAPSGSTAARSAPLTLAPDAFVRELRTKLAASEVADAKSMCLRAPEGVDCSYGLAGGFDLTLSPAFSAKQVIALFEWRRAYGVSGDAHQRRFSIRLFTQQLDPKRIASEAPTVGGYRVDAILTARPVGPLPGLAAGASPAYDLEKYAAEVGEIHFTPQPAP